MSLYLKLVYLAHNDLLEAEKGRALRDIKGGKDVRMNLSKWLLSRLY